MPINSDKPHLWKADVSQSIDYYNDWFLRFAPDVYREQRQTQSAIVKAELERSNYLRRINAEFLKDSPGSLQILRMATAPPLARDRLIGMAYVTPNLVNSMEGKTNIPSRLLLIALFYRSMLSRTTYPLLLKQNLPATSPIQTNAVRKKHRN